MQELVDKALEGSIEETDVEKQIEQALNCPCVGTYVLLLLLLCFIGGATVLVRGRKE